MKRVFYLLTIICCSCSEYKSKPPELRSTGIVLEAYDSVRLFAKNVISTNMNERDIAISPEGNEIIFTLGNFNNTRRALVHLKESEGEWSLPRILPFSGLYQDIEPFFNPDGSRLYFASTRPINGDSLRTDYNIWYVERGGSGYGNPMDAGPVINTPKDEFYPSVSDNGNLYFTATYDFGIGSEDIYISRYVNEQYTRPEPLDSAINSITYEFNAYVSPMEDIIIFSSYGRPDGFGGGDLYISQKDENGKWLPSRNLGNTINSSALDYCPYLDIRRNIFYFTSNRRSGIKTEIKDVEDMAKEYSDILNGLGNIYMVKSSQLGILD